MLSSHPLKTAYILAKKADLPQLKDQTRRKDYFIKSSVNM